MLKRSDIERILIGKCVLGAEEAIAEATCKGIIPSFFRGEIPRLVFARLQQLLKQKAPIDINNITPPDCNLNASAVCVAISDMISAAATADNLEWYCSELKGRVAEDILSTARREASQAIDAGLDIHTVAGQFKKAQIRAVELTGANSGFTTIADHVYELLNQIDSAVTSQNPLFTGFKTIDNLCIAMMPGDLIILAGRPSMGKTALCLDILDHNARMQVKSLMISMEQSPMSVAARMLAKHAKMSTSKALRTPERLMQWERDSMLNASAPLLVTMPYILLMDKARPNINLIEDAIHRAVDLGARLVAIDYLQLIKRKGGERPDLEIGENCEQIKAIGKECSVPVILLAQLNRGNEKDNRPPKASDLRDSGGIEQAADFIWFPHCKHEDAKQSGERYFIQEKGRDAGVGFGKLYFHKETASFYELGGDNANPR